MTKRRYIKTIGLGIGNSTYSIEIVRRVLPEYYGKEKGNKQNKELPQSSEFCQRSGNEVE